MTPSTKMDDRLTLVDWLERHSKLRKEGDPWPVVGLEDREWQQIISALRQDSSGGVGEQEIKKILQDACDRDWEDETLYQTAVIAANGLYWRGKNIAELKARLAAPHESRSEVLDQILGALADIANSSDMTLEVARRKAARMYTLASRAEPGAQNTPGEPNRDLSTGTSHSESDGSATKPTTPSSQGGASQGTAPILSPEPSADYARGLEDACKLVMEYGGTRNQRVALCRRILTKIKPRETEGK
jgi:hypothetical protein